MENYDVVILGAGPAGLTATIYLSRMLVSNIVIDSGAPGGQLLNTFRVENYTGIENKSGTDIAFDFYNHAKSMGAKITNGRIKEIQNINDKIKRIIFENGKVIETKAIIVATGLNPRKLDVKNYDKFFGRGIHTCLICDAPLYKNKEIAIIGGGNSAIEESLFGLNMVKKLHVINIADELTAFEYLIHEINERKNVVIHNKSKLNEIIEKDGKISSIKIENLDTQKVTTIEDISGIFTYIGWNPNTFFLPKEILNEEKYVIVDKECATSIAGIFAAGDVTMKAYKQIVVATSDGAIAALSAKQYIEKLK